MADADRVGEYYRLSLKERCRAIQAVANTVYTLTKPANTDRAYIVATSPVWITLDGSNPVVSTGTSTSAERSPLAPSNLWIGGATELRIISAVAQTITVEFRGDANAT